MLRLYCLSLYSTVKLQLLHWGLKTLCVVQKKKKARKRLFSPPPPFLSLTIRFLEPAHAIRFSVCLCAWLVSALSLKAPWHSTPLFTALLGLSLHSNSTIMQPVWPTTTTPHDCATTIELLTADCVLSYCCCVCMLIILRLFTYLCDLQV